MSTPRDLNTVAPSAELSPASSNKSFDTALSSLTLANEGQRTGERVRIAQERNSETSPVVERCAHELIEAQAQAHPHAQAIFAWDGTMSYRELNEAADRLAIHLIYEHGVQVEDIVHVCFEKSLWYWVSVLAINKAGAAWSPIDATHPLKRNQSVVAQTVSKLILSSPSNSSLCRELVRDVVVVAPALDQQLATQTPHSNVGSLHRVSPRNACYVLFTSGSTGTPKGFVMEHVSLCTSVTAIYERLALPSDRPHSMLQFASFLFDMSVGEAFLTLPFGGCLCVPSADDRLENLPGFVREAAINIAFLTPALARAIRPSDYPSLDMLILAGEAVGRDILEMWLGSVRVINGWGPAETCIVSTMHEFKSLDESSLTIGTPVGDHCWIVDPNDPSQLAPIGTEGEIVIQGPGITREYLADRQKTDATIMTAPLPSWATDRHSARHNRIFKSGDLATYNEDGSIRFSSRKDTQVKIRGLRVELGEVEYHVKATFSGAKQVVVDVLNIGSSQSLVAYFCLNNKTEISTNANSLADMFLPLKDEEEAMVRSSTERLGKLLPPYMVPATLIPCRYMPVSSSTKLDRKVLTNAASKLGRRELAAYSLQKTSAAAPETPKEIRLQAMWAEILDLPAEMIGRHDKFTAYGGDSIKAMQLAHLARSRGLHLDVRTIFQSPQLEAMALEAKEAEQVAPSQEVQPWSLVDGSVRSALERASTRNQLGLPPDAVIQDAYPCSPLQEGLMALALKHPGSYLARWYFRLESGIDVVRFRAAWEQTVAASSNLRTRIVQLGDSMIQAVLQDDVEWENPEKMSVSEYSAVAERMTVSWGSRLTRYVLLETPRNELYFVFVGHHAIYDGWSMQLHMNTLRRFYESLSVDPAPEFSAFVKYLGGLDPEVASEYWKQQLNQVNPTAFPPKPRSSTLDRSTVARKVSRKIAVPTSADGSITNATFLRAAWAVVMSRYSESEDVCFGSTVSGRQAPVNGVDLMPGVVIATVPVHVNVDKQMTPSAFLRGVQDQAMDMIAFEQFGLQNIAKVSDEAREACEFTSLMVVQPMKYLNSQAATENFLVLEDTNGERIEELPEGYFNYPLVCQCFVYDSYVNVVLEYMSDTLSHLTVDALSHQFESVVNQLVAPEKSLMREIDVASKWDVEMAHKFNSQTPKVVNACVHDLIDEQARSNPDSPAIVSWDGTISYAELAAASSRLANLLQSDYNVKTGDLVHVCFEKSIWHFVSIIAINKAGAAWVPLDPSHPVARQKQIVSQTKAKLGLASTANASSLRDLIGEVIEVSRELDQQLCATVKAEAPRAIVSPRDAAYILFTSGSTGTPKGLVMEHRSVCTSQLAASARLGMTSNARMLQFAAFVFDLSIGEIFGPLLSGASIVVPSDEIRMNSLVSFIKEKNINWCYLTPSFARTIRPSEVPSVELMLLGGEGVPKDVFDRWFGNVRLVNAWGPAETCCFSSLHEWSSADESPMTIGRPVGSFCWIADPEDPQSLAPIGTVGEVMIQGPTILREYLADPSKTEASIVRKLPRWAKKQDQFEIFFKSGDLCSYNQDGTMEFLSRKDTQIKIRGLRVELGEIEHHIKDQLPDTYSVAVDVFKSNAGTNLVAYFCSTGETRSTSPGQDFFLPLDSELQVELQALVSELEVKLPRYMIPTMFIRCSYMPSITSTKLDRAGLKKRTAGLTQEELASYALVDTLKEAPEEGIESTLQMLWAQILNVDSASIGRRDSFFQLGGDSIAAIYLAAAVRESGLELTVKDVFDDPRLLSVAQRCQAVGDVLIDPVELAPFCMLSDEEASLVHDAARDQCQLSDSQAVADAYPCTPLQEGLMALSLKQPGSYIAKCVYRLSKNIDLERFESAWEQTVLQCVNLRTRIVQLKGKPIQVVLDKDLQWESAESTGLTSFLESVQGLAMSFGSQLHRYALVNEASGASYFVWVAHHAIYDGWTMRLMQSVLSRNYHGYEPVELKNYNTFIEYTANLDETAAKQFWTNQLKDSKMASYPPRSRKPNSSPKGTDCHIRREIDVDSEQRSSATQATLVRAVWAIVLARYCETDDICFGTSVSGRQAPVHDLSEMPGPMVSTVPVRVKLDPERKVSEFLQDVQRQAVAMTAHEQFGLQNIAKMGFEEACDFSSLLVVQPFNRMASLGADSDRVLQLDEEYGNNSNETISGYFNYPLVVQVELWDDYVELNLTFDSGVVTEAQMNRLTVHFEHVFWQLSESGSARLKDVSVSSSWDLEQAQKYNSKEPEVVDETLHGLIEKQAVIRPDDPAIIAWDGLLTYKELDEKANMLANSLLRDFQVGTGDFVHVCFEKSMWHFIAILAINKAGAAWVPLDPSHPPQRQHGIVGQTKATLALVSTKNLDICKGTVKDTLVVSSELFDKFTQENVSVNRPEVKVSPNQPAYVLFTSGSTGTPKGLVMQHVAAASSQTAIGEFLGLQPDVRMLQFASFVFDLSIGEIFGPLIHGASIVVPSEDIRMNSIVLFIKEHSVSWMFLTPSFTRTLRPEEVPSVELLLLAGEAVPRDVFDQWIGKVRFANGWGPAETCCFSTMHEWKSANESPVTIGRPIGSFCWIVDPENPDRLAPIGTVGEVMIQGPTLLREYLDDEEKTRAATVTELPEWAPNHESTRFNRFFKSGDLCAYNEDGTIEFHTRKDTQVKIRGLRVELGEVEHHIHQALHASHEVAVDVLRTAVGTSAVAYFCSRTDDGHDAEAGEDIFLAPEREFRAAMNNLVSELSVALPRYMIPQFYIPCSYLPFITSTKLNRKKLQQVTGALTREQLLQYALSDGDKQAPETDMEVLLQQIWADTLKVDIESIGRQDNFLRIGGDSISAIHLVSAAQKRELLVTVKDVFDDPRLFRLAEKLSASTGEQGVKAIEVPAFSLLANSVKAALEDKHQTIVSLNANQAIEDAYPCTPIQEGLMALSVKQPGSYIATWVYHLAEGVDVSRFKTAFEKTIKCCPNLRTRIVQVEGETLQAVVNNDIEWDIVQTSTLSGYLATANSFKMTYGSKLNRYAVVEDQSGDRYFVWSGHHAIYDGWTMRLMLSTLSSSYHEADTFAVLQNYSHFIKYVTEMDRDAAQEFWINQLRNAQPATYPPPSQASSKAVQVTRRTITFSPQTEDSFTKATIVRAAWAMILAKYCDTEDICFGTTVSGRQSSVPGLSDMPGPMVATVPIRVRIDRDQETSAFLETIQNQASETTAYEQFGLQNIAKLGFQEACDFTSLLVVQPSQKMSKIGSRSDSILKPYETSEQEEADDLAGYFNYPLVAQVELIEQGVEVSLTYNPAVLSEIEMTRLLHHYTSVFQGLTDSKNRLLREISAASSWDIEQAVLYNNAKNTQTVEATLHGMIEEHARVRPDAPAVVAWDRSFTYGQLDDAASALAYLLTDTYNVQRGDLVPVCFEKSSWYFVSILAINKAGAAWIPLDPGHPTERHSQIISQTGSRLALASPSNAHLLRSLIQMVIEVSEGLHGRLEQRAPSVQSANQTSTGSPSDAAYVLFTSGSTGVPKGLVMEHASICTSLVETSRTLGINPDVRMLQFAAFVFDLSVGEIFGPLLHGGSIIVPSEDTRMNDLTSFMNEHKVNWTYQTPSFARTLSPGDLSLEVMVLAGEAVPRDVFDTWFGKVRLANGWGPAETTCFSTIHEWTSANESPLTVGRPFASMCWIVDPEDHTKLAPVGTVGEVLIQGPTLFREYLADEVRTQESVVRQSPSWLPKLLTTPHTRAYMSGDLCKYNDDGSIRFVSRKDTQVKIRGMRVELGEVEHNIMSAFQGARQVAVDVLRSENGSNLVAYICSTDDVRPPGVGDGSWNPFLSLTDDMRSYVSGLVGQLGVKLPRYMIPTYFIPCSYMPFITSGKLDRKGLQAFTRALSDEELAHYSLQSGEKRAPETATEARIQVIWAKMLSIPPSQVGRDDSFLQLGGDSISVIHFIGLARKEGLELTVQTVFDDPRLSAVASKVNEASSAAEAVSCVPFSLLDEHTATSLKSYGGSQYAQVVDAFPCTPLQEGLMALSAKLPGSYVAKQVLQISQDVDIARLKEALALTVQAYPTMRTRMVLSNGTPYQLVMDEPMQWEQSDGLSLRDILSRDVQMSYNTPLNRFALVKDGQDDYLVWIVHHAVFDGWSIRVILSALKDAYDNLTVPAGQSFSPFVRFVTSIDEDEAKKYWASQLAGAKPSSFPAVNHTRTSSIEPGSLEKRISFPPLAKSTVTRATILRAAWAIILAQYSEADDICFGATVSGRQAKLPGIESIAGPVIATVPVRMAIEKQQSVVEFLSSVQNQATVMIEYEQIGLQNIAKISPEAKEACQLTSLLVIQPKQDFFEGSAGSVVRMATSDKYQQQGALDGYFTYPLVLQAEISDENIDLSFNFHANVATEKQLVAISHQLEHVIQQLAAQDDTPLGSVSVAGAWDQKQMLSWNPPPKLVDDCIHDVIAQTARQVPEREALYSSAGSLTYRELDEVTTNLAGYLAHIGVANGSLVAICFEKSLLAVVTMLGILKAGCGFVPLDPQHPKARKEQLIKDTDSHFLLASPTTFADHSGLADCTIEVSDELLSSLTKYSQYDDGIVKSVPTDVAYVLFTSGSTGKPKGVVIEHRALCSSAVEGQRPLHEYKSHRRVLQFSSYVFDVSMGEIFTTLAHGGTVCVPTEKQRLQETANFIEEARINTAMLTPSFVHTISPDAVPNLEQLVIAGEKPSQEVIDTWQNRVRLVNAYGPAEGCIYSTYYKYTSAGEIPGMIGRGMNIACWVVDPVDHNRLVPVGCVGELLIQGHTLARGYLNDESKTRESFVDAVPWTPAEHQGLRLYKTGDLVKYHPDGQLEYLGRRDNQVKIRGVRIELGEIELAIATSAPHVEHVAVDVYGEDSNESLVAFMSSPGWATEGLDRASFLNMSVDLKTELQELATKIKDLLPGYMMPSIFMPVRAMPFNSSLKLDRRALKEMMGKLTQQQISEHFLSATVYVEPTTELELKLRSIWAKVLGTEASRISKTDSFLQIGGDSISALHVVSQAQKQNIGLSVYDIFKSSTLESMAAAATVLEDDDDEPGAAPFSLVTAETLEKVIISFQPQNGESIVDAYPCSPLQEGLMGLSVTRPGSYIARHYFRLSKDISVARFRQAWEETVRRCSNLRTRILEIDGKALQVVISGEKDLWFTVDKTNHDGTKQVEMTYGSRLNLFGLGTDESGSNIFVWLAHHSVFDGWTMQLVFKTLLSVYYGTECDRLNPYSSFVDYVSHLDQSASTEYWKQQLTGAQRAPFPTRNTKISPDYTPATRLRYTSFRSPTLPDTSVTKASLLRAAWAVLLSRYSGTNDVTFGATVSGRNAPLRGIDSMPGVAIATVPVRVRLNPSQSVRETLQAVQEQASDMIIYEQFGLQNIARIDADIRDACDFSSLMVVQPLQQMGLTTNIESGLFEPSETDLEELEDSMQGYFNYPLVVQCAISDQKIDLYLFYDSEVLEEIHAEALTHQFEQVVRELAHGGQQQIEDVSMTSQWDMDRAMSLNCDLPDVVDSCMHEIIAARASEQPHAPAIDAWDGKLSYKELDEASNKLANYLVENFGVKPNMFVHVCFDKSVWHFVAILGINKAGAAWSPIDPSHPINRKRQIVAQTGSSLVLTSPRHSESSAEIFKDVVQVTPSFMESLDRHKSASAPKTAVTPDDPAYILFTSGSTGVPKGFVIQHRALCSDQNATAYKLRMASDVRMLQFAAFGFDLSIGEIFGPLSRGGCLCVPSEDARLNDIQSFIRDHNINWAYLTPSFARTMRPDQVPSLELLVFAGEAVPRDVYEQWFGRVRLVNGWGPAETICFATLHEYSSLSGSSATVGCPVGSLCWIVDPEDPHKLAPIGTAGEVIIQGPTLLREYLGNQELTNATLLSEPPSWAEHHAPFMGRLYKSGDLCSYNADGTIEFVSRKDTQVKIRGLRVELGEVEHHVQSNLKGVRQVVVDVLKTATATHLVLFFSFSDKIAQTSELVNVADLFSASSSEVQQMMRDLVASLNASLPRYMIPSLFVPCRCMPFISSTKLDRKKLCAAASGLPVETLATYTLQEMEKVAPETEMELRLQQIWSRTLQLPIEAIGRDDSFLDLGGDSVIAIHFLAAARRDGLRVTVQDVFRDPRLRSIAATVHVAADETNDTSSPAPFSLLHAEDKALVHSGALQTQCHLPEGIEIEDAYPCTPLQAGLMAIMSKQPGAYVIKHAYQLAEDVDVPAFKAAWEQTVKLSTNLRTRIVEVNGTALQVVLSNGRVWEDTNQDAKSFIAASRNFDVGYGAQLARSALFEEDGKSFFVFICHHSVFDGWCMGLALSTLRSIYNGLEPPFLQPFSRFIRHLKKVNDDSAATYWANQLNGAEMASFPGELKITTPRSEGKVTQTVNRTMTWPTSSVTNVVTRGSIARAAWAFVLARYSETNDICFGVTVSGRAAPVPGLEQMSGPAVATVPVRVRLDDNATVESYLSSVQSQAFEMVDYEQYGLQNISQLGEHARAACNFSSLFTVQPASGGIEESSTFLELAEDKLEGALEEYFNYPLVAECIVSDETVTLSLIYNSYAIPQARVEALSAHYEHVAHQMLQDSTKTLRELSVSGPWDMDKISSWNEHDVEPVNECLHSLVARQAQLAPGREAVYTCSGSLTYAELDMLSSKLAQHLESLGVTRETRVALCLEKSKWAIVAMLGILKAGGTFIPIDPSHSLSRRQDIIGQANANHVVASPATSFDFSSKVSHTVELSDALMTSLPSPESYIPKNARPDSAAYIIFSSGSTGKPKGIIIEHAGISTTITKHGHLFDVDNETIRYLQFGSFAFDVCLYEVFIPLSRGGTVCVPTEEERLNDTVAFVNRSRANVALLTPSFARTIQPEQVPTFKVLMLGGEAAASDSLDTWASHVKLLNGFGPTETCVVCAAHVWDDTNRSPTTIGKSLAHTSWVVEVGNLDRLAPVRCVGELVIQGNALARGYLNDEAKTNASFIERNVPWMPESFCQRPNRFYKTGDLVSYNADGTLEYHGRLDTQVKVRGQRIELGEVESCIKRVSDLVEHSAASVIKRESGQTLVAYVSFTESMADEYDDDDGPFLALNAELRDELQFILRGIKEELPSYMVPTIIFPMRDMPLMGASMKLDRSSLASLTNMLTTEELESFSLFDTERRAPKTPAELTLQTIWSEVLNIPAESISTNDNFYHVGGDSISIIKVAKLIEQRLAVKFSSRTLSDIHTTIQSIAVQIEGSDASSQASNAVDLAAEVTELTSSLNHPLENMLNNSKTPFKQDSTVFLTGASGYLGVELLRHLLNSPDVGRVIAHVRTSSPEEGLERIKRTAEISKCWDPQLSAKIEVWIGDLSSERLGLNESQWSRLCGESRTGNVDAIIHNGAAVNWNLSYNSLRAANVESTMLLVEAAMMSPANAKFVFVSGGVSLLRIPSHEAAIAAVESLNGYIQTKLVADLVLKNIIAQLPSDQNRISVLKPGRIIGMKDKGVANTDDYLWRAVAGAVSLGTYPQADFDQWISIADVSTISQHIVGKLFEDAIAEPFHDLVVGVSTPKFWELVNDQLDMPLIPVSWDEWIEQAKQLLEKYGDKHPMWSIQDFLSSLGTPYPERGFNVEGEVISEHLEAAVVSNVTYLKSIGYLQTSGASYTEVGANVIKRSKAFGGAPEHRVIRRTKTSDVTPKPSAMRRTKTTWA